MKGLKLVLIAITAFAVVAVTGCSEPVKVPNVSVLRVKVLRISTKNPAVARKLCQWQIYTFKGGSVMSLQKCMSMWELSNNMIPLSLMRWKKPAEYDTDRCPIKGKLSDKCKKIIKIFSLRDLFSLGSTSHRTNDGNIVDSDKVLRKDVLLDKASFIQSFPNITIGVKSVIAWAKKMNKLATITPPIKNPG